MKEKLIKSFFKSEEESKRFKMNIVRGKSDSINLKEIQSQIISQNTDVLFLRIPSVKSEQIQNLSKLGYEFYQTDTLVYYISDFEKYSPKELKNFDLKFKKATKDDKHVLKQMVHEIFMGYTNHYFSNQFLDKKGILEGYTEWVVSFIDDHTKEVFLVYRNDIPVAFATCSLEDNIAEGVLYGVMPDNAGGGVYSDIIRYTQKYYLDKGVTKMKVSTQVQNYAVQKVWIREGFYMNESYSTIHINSLLSFSKFPVKEYKFEVTEELISNYANVSKDFNVIHFDDDEARKCGFEGKISHGLLACGEISRILGTDYPGKGTVFMNYKNIFLVPLYPNKEYKFVLSTPFHNDKGIFLCLVKVYDSQENLVMLSYNQLINKL